MNYKKIIKSRNTRVKILNMFSWVPDKTMVKLQYRIKTGRKLDLKNPKRYTEKLQYYKLYHRNPIMRECVDKYEVRDYVKSKGLGDILNDIYGVYESPNEISFDDLPDSFVLKDTLGGGGNSVIIVSDKNKEDLSTLKKKMSNWTSGKKIRKDPGREWVYDGQKHRIIAEKTLESSDDAGLVDYKFFCFDGKVKYIYVIADRKLGGEAKLAIYDNKFNKLNCYRKDEIKLERRMKKPKCFDEMIKYAEVLSADFPHVRVDFYDCNDSVVFGELTFFDGSGYMCYEPDEFDFELGRCFKI